MEAGQEVRWFVYHVAIDGAPSAEGYIGVSSNPSKRFEQHKKNKTVVGSAIRKYGLTANDIRILAEFDDEKLAYDYEKELRPQPNMGWNITEGGKGYLPNHSHSIWSRVKMSSSSRGKRKSHIMPETYLQIAEKQRGRTRPKIECPFCGFVGAEGNMQRWHFGRCKDAPKQTRFVNGYDFDGVVNMGDYPGLRPSTNDIIISGRSYEERAETETFLKNRGLAPQIFLAPHPFNEKTRAKSGMHKGQTIWKLFCGGTTVQVFFEDDWEQYQIIKGHIRTFALPTKLVLVNHGGLVELENVRRADVV